MNYILIINILSSLITICIFLHNIYKCLKNYFSNNFKSRFSRCCLT